MGSDSRVAVVTGASSGIRLYLLRMLSIFCLPQKTRNWSLGVLGPNRKRELRGCSPSKSSLGDHCGSDFDSTK